MPNQSLYLFVYGSLRKGFQHEAYMYIRDNFSLIGDASVKGKLYYAGEYPCAVPSEENFYVKGELYKANSSSAFQWAIAQLDDYEGLNVEQGETALFQRKLEIVVSGNEQIPAWVYWYNLPYQHLPLIESGDYLTFTQQ